MGFFSHLQVITWGSDILAWENRDIYWQRRPCWCR